MTALFAGSTVHLKLQSGYGGKHHNLNSFSVVSSLHSFSLGASAISDFVYALVQHAHAPPALPKDPPQLPYGMKSLPFPYVPPQFL